MMSINKLTIAVEPKLEVLKLDKWQKILEKVLELSNDKEQYELKINIGGINDDILKLDGNHLDLNFFVISADEMAEIFGNEGEKVGGFIGEYIFISEDCPKNYMQFVVLGLAIRRLELFENDNSAILQKIKRFDDVNSSHWTNLLFDIMYAKSVLDEIEFKNYLKWRRSVERSNAFVDPDMSKMIEDYTKKRMLKRRYAHYKAVTLPQNRSWRTKLSNEIANIAATTGSECEGDLNALMSSVKGDVLLTILVKSELFDIKYMIELIDFIKNADVVTEIKEYSSFRFDKVRREVVRTVTVPNGLERQAFLLTQYYCGGNNLLISYENEPLKFGLVPNYKKSIEALRDRLTSAAIAPLLKIIESSPKEDRTGLDPFAIYFMDFLKVPNVHFYNGGLIDSSMLETDIEAYIEENNKKLNDLLETEKQLSVLIRDIHSIMNSIGVNYPSVLLTKLKNIREVHVKITNSISDIKSKLGIAKNITDIYKRVGCILNNFKNTLNG